MAVNISGGGSVGFSFGSGGSGGGPLVNGYLYDYSSVRLKINGKETLGQAVTAIDYSDNLPPGEVRGSSAQVLGLARGEYKAEGALEIPKDVFDTFLDEITEGGSVGYLEARFGLSISYAESGAPLVTDDMVGCKLVSTRHNTRRTQDGIIVQVPLYVQYLILNGKYPLSSQAMNL